MSDVFEIPAGSHVFLGVPANPLSKEAVDLLRKVISEESLITEAHIPQCYIPAMMSKPRQVLFIIFASQRNSGKSVSSLMDRLAQEVIFPDAIDIFPLTATHELVGAVRNSGCQIYLGEQGVFADEAAALGAAKPSPSTP